MKLVTAQQMASIDRRAIEQFGIPGIQLMERAGTAVFTTINQMWDELAGKKVVIFCGKGNNGGDGLVVARLLAEHGASVLVLLLGKKDQSKGDAQTNLKKALELKVSVRELLKDTDLTAAEQAVQDADLLVDAIFGTGLKGTVKGLAAGVIETINRCGRPVVAVDIPSGLDADGGEISGPCVQATTTVTFGLPKIGQVFYPGKSKCGRLIVAEIGYPPEVIEEERCRTNLVTGEEVAQLLPRRAPDAYKGSCGRIAIVAGSVGMTGAAALASMAALRIGAGLVTLGLPASLNDILEVKLTEVMTKPLPEVRKRRCIALRAVGEIRRMLLDADCLAIGPGLGTHHETAEMVRRVVARETKVPTVIDADGLNALAKDISSLRETGAEIVITPHAGELSRLTGRPIAEITASPLKAAESFAQEFKLTVVLKGAPTVIATPDAELYVNSTGNAGMATAGSGDVLTGTIVGLIGQGLTPAEAAIAGVFIHGKAGDLARQQKGEMGLVAGDILQFLPDATQKDRGGGEREKEQGSRGVEGSNFVLLFVGGFFRARGKLVGATHRGRPGS